MRTFDGSIGALVSVAALWAASTDAAQADAIDGSCWHTSDADPSRYELIIKPSTDLHPDRVISILKAAGVEGCKQMHGVAGVCLATYSKGDPATPPQKAEELVRRGRWLHGNYFDYVFPNAIVRLLPEPRGTGYAKGQEYPQPELADLGAAAAWEAVPPSAPVVTGIIDAGIDLSHPALIGNLQQGQDFNCANVTTVQCKDPPDSTNGHGTHMAGIIAAHDDVNHVRGVAWNTHIVSLRAFKDEDSTDLRVGLAVEWASTHHVDVVNASWEFDCPLPFTGRQIQLAAEHGTLFVTAAGNGGDHVGPGHKTLYPQAYAADNMIVVMAHNRAMKPDDVSDWGVPPVDIAAPGTGLTTGDGPAGDCSSDDVCYSEEGPSTSGATAYVAGAAALLKSAHPDWTARWLKTQLLDSAISDSSLQGKSAQGARLMLDRALQGPLEIQIPALGTSWSSAEEHTVEWSNDYPSQLCTGVTISLQLGNSARVDIATNQANSGSARVRLPTVATTTAAVLRLTCQPGGISTSSADFTLLPASGTGR